MRIFLSWSGERSRTVAELLHAWLPEVIQSLDPWMSSTDIDPGNYFREILRHTLSEIHFGVLCLTKDNYTAPWVLFEAGALARAVENAVVCPYLVDLAPQDLADPLKDLQAVPADREGTYRLLQRINQANQRGNLAEDRLQRSFNRCWRELDAGLSRLLSTSGPECRTEEFFIINKESSHCLQPDGTTNESPVAIVPFRGNARQKWSFHEVGPNLFAITSAFSNKCLDVKEKRKDPDSAVHQYKFIGEPQQKWKIEECEDGSYSFQNVNSGHYLGIKDAVLKQLGYRESNIQRWWLQPSFTEVVEPYH